MSDWRTILLYKVQLARIRQLQRDASEIHVTQVMKLRERAVCVRATEDFAVMLDYTYAVVHEYTFAKYIYVYQQNTLAMEYRNV